MNKVIPVFDHSREPNVGRMPAWIRQPLAADPRYGATGRAVHGQRLHTVCEEARCPNRGECWSAGTATFMLLGDTCTRACGFCAVKTGRPEWHDPDEPARVAEAVAAMGLDYVVLTSVNRDDLPDGGAGIYADTIAALRNRLPGIGIELLTPDFHRRQTAAVEIIHGRLQTVPAPGRTVQMVWGHNVETVPALYRTVRKGSDYHRSLDLLAAVAALDGVEAKSALMLGLGETPAQVRAVLADLRAAGVRRLALGQYLRPSRHHLPVREYVTPAAFDAWGQTAREMGFTWVKSGPMVRSSYHAEDENEGSPS